MRSGPSFDHPIKLIYKKKYLPVVILDKVETWRKIIDFQNNSADDSTETYIQAIISGGKVFEYTQDNQEQLASDLQNNINNLS